MTRPLLTIGFLVDTLGEEYQRRLFAGVCAEAERLNVNVRCFVGGVLSTTSPVAQRNRVYAAASAAHLDGLVVAAGPLSNVMGQAVLEQFVAGFEHLPVCSVGIQVPGVESVAIDNAAGVREALTHLIEESGRRRIAFIRGPEGNHEAEERYHVYRDVLAAHRLVLDPDLVARGDFEAASGRAAIATFLDDRHIGFDAILAASDLMALGALNALVERGVPVPNRVGVVGFDDIDAARFAAPPLTTVRQPLRDMGRRALQSVLHQIYETPADSRLVLPARLIRRQSSRAPGARTSVQPAAPNEQADQARTLDMRTELIEALNSLGGTVEALEAEWPEHLCNTFLADAAGRRSGIVQRLTFLSYVEHLLLRLAEIGADVSAFHGVLSRMRQLLIPTFAADAAKRALAEELWHEARVLCGNIAERAQVQQRLHADHHRRAVQDVGGELLRAPTYRHLAAVLNTRLPLLGIPSCALCVFVDGERAQLQAACDGGLVIECPSAPFPQRELLPAGVLGFEHRRTLIVETLFTRDLALGYVIFEMGPSDAETYSTLRDYLTGAVRGLIAETRGT